MRKTLNGRLQKCQSLAGQPRVPGDPKTRMNQVTMASLLADMTAGPEPGLKAQKGRPDAVVAFAVGSPYPPCTLLLQDLRPMKLSDLRMDTHHRGRVLTVQRAAPVVKLVAWSWTVVQEDSSAKTERLEVLLHKSKHDHDILESGSIFEIKEPYFTLSDQGDPTLRIDHPSDLVVRTDSLPTDGPYSSSEELGDSEGAVSATAPTTLVAKTASECKEEGNAALKQKDLPLALASYTQGLKLVPTDGAAKEELAYDLLRNRACVNLILNRFDEQSLMPWPLSPAWMTRNTKILIVKPTFVPGGQHTTSVNSRKPSISLRSSRCLRLVTTMEECFYGRLYYVSRSKPRACTTSRKSRPACQWLVHELTPQALPVM